MTCHVIGRGTQLCVDWPFEKPTGVSGGYTRDTRSYAVMQESINQPGLDRGRGKIMLPHTPFIMSNVIHLQISTFFFCLGPFTLMLVSIRLFTYFCGT